MMGLALEAADVRLGMWQRILRDEAVPVSEIDRELLPLARDGAEGEKMPYILLRACLAAAEEMTPAMRRNLRAALVYWFSQTGSPVESGHREPADLGDLRSVVGQRLTWSDCARLFGINPDDYTAYRRLVDRLEEAVRAEWQAAFGSACPLTREV
jgi:hypothetical protein